MQTSPTIPSLAFLLFAAFSACLHFGPPDLHRYRLPPTDRVCISLTRARFEEPGPLPWHSELRGRGLSDPEIDKSSAYDDGSSTSISRIIKLVSNFCTGKESNKTMNPNKAFATGAAHQAVIASSNILQMV
ncbi:hypothetical protein SISNIDRAFT_465784 [Sistotremastrum niveocremeum HHB9708]|uniref:Secreted protein n=1 Tax=Sistotremastrum niveocremeum HHB9708 TaxID=1314777 RepID=A0A164UW98_9AGAM|nr:hypothetical protein SISNIDRAFT_465784 [Sistotremastrum niveocremeum HHB9708]